MYEMRGRAMPFLRTLAGFRSPLSQTSETHSSRLLPIFEVGSESSVCLLQDRARLAELTGEESIVLEVDSVPESSVHANIVSRRMRSPLFSHTRHRWTYQILCFAYHCHARGIGIGPLDSNHIDLVEDAIVLNHVYHRLHIDKHEKVIQPSPYNRTLDAMRKEAHINPIHWCYLISKFSTATSSNHLQQPHPTSFDRLMTFSSTHNVPGVYEISKSHEEFEEFKRDLKRFIEQANLDMKYIGCILLELWACEVLPLNARDAICQLSFSFDSLSQYIDYAKFPLSVIRILELVFRSIEDPIWEPLVHMDNKCGEVSFIYSLPYFEAIHDLLNECHRKLYHSEREQRRLALLRAQTAVEWTPEDEAMRLEAKRRRMEERRRKAEQGRRLAQLRVRDERYRMWFANQSEEEQRRILRREAAQRTTKENKDLRRSGIRIASFHNWDAEAHRSWLFEALRADLCCQFKVLKSTRRAVRMVNFAENKRSVISMAVVENCLAELTLAVGKQSERKIINTIGGDETSLLGSDHTESTEAKQTLTKLEAPSALVAPLESRTVKDVAPLFDFLAKSFSAKLSSIHTCRAMRKTLQYAIAYAEIEVNSEEIAGSLSPEQLRQRRNIAAVEVLRDTYAELSEAARWAAEMLNVRAAEGWVSQAQSWMASAIFERYTSECESRAAGETLAASRICAGVRGRSAVLLYYRIFMLVVRIHGQTFSAGSLAAS